MSKKQQTPEIYLDEYLDPESAGRDYVERRECDVYDADAVIIYDDEYYIDIEKYDRYVLKKLKRLKRKAEKATSLTAVEEYELYAHNVFHDKHDLVKNVFSWLSWDKKAETIAEVRQKFDYVKANYLELWEHFVYAKELWFDVKGTLPESSEEKTQVKDDQDGK